MPLRLPEILYATMKDLTPPALLVCRENGDSTSVKLFEQIIDEEQIHYNYFDNVSNHIKNLDGTYLAQIAGTPSATGLNTMGFVARQGGGGTPGGAA
jgi:bacterioferritin